MSCACCVCCCTVCARVFDEVECVVVPALTDGARRVAARKKGERETR